MRYIRPWPNYLAVLLLPLGLLPTGCETPETRIASDSRTAEVEDTLLAIADAYNSAWEQWDADAILAFHGQGFTYYFFDQKVDDNFEEVLREQWLSGSQSYSIQMIDPDVGLLGRDGAVVSFRFKDREVTNEGDVLENSGALAYIFERDGGEWQIVRMHHSGTVPQLYE